jgi:hypothetical protein
LLSKPAIPHRERKDKVTTVITGKHKLNKAKELRVNIFKPKILCPITPSPYKFTQVSRSDVSVRVDSGRFYDSLKFTGNLLTRTWVYLAVYFWKITLWYVSLPEGIWNWCWQWARVWRGTCCRIGLLRRKPKASKKSWKCGRAAMPETKLDTT